MFFITIYNMPKVFPLTFFHGSSFWNGCVEELVSCGSIKQLHGFHNFQENVINIFVEFKYRTWSTLCTIYTIRYSVIKLCSCSYCKCIIKYRKLFSDSQIALFHFGKFYASFGFCDAAKLRCKIAILLE